MNSLEHFEQTNTTTEKARDIACNLELFIEKEKAGELRVFKILDELKKQNLLEQEIIRVKKLFAQELAGFTNEFGEDCWELLTILELFDEETARHCVNTYLIAKDKVEKKLWSNIILADEFNKEDVKLSQFYRACLLHDIGKIEVPHSVLVNQITDEKCSMLLLEHKEDILIPVLKNKFGSEYVFPENIQNEIELLDYIHDGLNTRPQTIAPIKLLLDSPITKEIELQLNHCGCSIDDSLIKVMQTHDEYSKKILQEIGFIIEGELAGAHHKHKTDEVHYKITIGTMQISIDIADIVHLADVENAILSKRYYKKGETSLTALKILSQHTKQGFIDHYVAYLWIADEISEIEKENMNDKDHENYKYITTFLEEEHKQNSNWPDWKIKY